MKITQVNLYHLGMRLRQPFETSSEYIDVRECILVEAFTGDIVGYGECVAARDPGYSYETVPTAWHILKDFLVPAILNQEIEDIRNFAERMNFVRGHPMAKAGLEMAVWDLQGKIQNRSLSELLGGVRKRVDVGVSVGIQNSPQKLLSAVEDYLAQGYRRVKIKIKPGRDVVETETVRRAYPNLRLQVDANSAYTLEMASMLAPLDDLNLLLIEQPLWDDDLWDHRLIQKQFRTPICLDESILSVRHARHALEMESCRVINIKPGRVGGLGESVAIHDLCFTRGVPVWCGGMLESGVGRAANLALASLPGFSLPGDISATERYYSEDITEQRFSLNADSSIDVPNGVGLGISIDQNALQRVTLAKIKLSG